MASNDYFELTEKYTNNEWAANILAFRTKDKEPLKTIVDRATSHQNYSSNIHSYGIYENNTGNTNCTSHEYSSTKLCLDGIYENNTESTDCTCHEHSCTKLNIDDVQLFGCKPLTDSLRLVMCWECKKFTKVQNLLSHIIRDHKSVEEYEKRNDIARKYAAYLEQLHRSKQNERTVNSSRKRKKVASECSFMLQALAEERSVDQPDPFLSQNSLTSQVPVEGENSTAHGDSYSVTKRKKGPLKYNRNKSKKGKTEVNCQLQEDVQNLSNNVLCEQSTSSGLWTESVLFSYHSSPDSNYSVNSGHLGLLANSTLYSSNRLISMKQSTALNFQSKETSQEYPSDSNYLHQSSPSVPNATADCSDQQSYTNTPSVLNATAECSEQQLYTNTPSVLNATANCSEQQSCTNTSSVLNATAECSEQQSYTNTPSVFNAIAECSEQQSYVNTPSVIIATAECSEQQSYTNTPSVINTTAECSEQQSYTNTPSVINATAECSEQQSYINTPSVIIATAECSEQPSYTNTPSVINATAECSEQQSCTNTPSVINATAECSEQQSYTNTPSVINAIAECSEQQSYTNNLKLIRTSSNQNFKQMNAKSSLSSNNEQQDIECTDRFLYIGNKQPVKSPPSPCQEPSSISNSKQYESDNSGPFLGDKKESSAPSICSSPKPEDSFSKKNTSMEDMPKNDRKVSSIHAPSLYCAGPNMSINRLPHSPYGLVLLNNRSDKLRRAFGKAIDEERARLQGKIRLKAVQDVSKCGTESDSSFTSKSSISKPSQNSVLQSPRKFVPHSFPDSVMQPSPNFALQTSSPNSVSQSSSPNSVSLPSSQNSVSLSLSSQNFASQPSPSSVLEMSVNSESQPSQISAFQPPQNFVSEVAANLSNSELFSSLNLDYNHKMCESVNLIENRNECDSVYSKTANSQYIKLSSQTTNSVLMRLNIAPQVLPYSASRPSSPNSFLQPRTSPNSLLHSEPSQFPNSVSQSYIINNYKSCEVKRKCNETSLKLLENSKRDCNSLGSKAANDSSNQTTNSMIKINPFTNESLRKYSNGYNNMTCRKDSEDNINNPNKLGVLFNCTIGSDNHTESNLKPVCDNNLNNSDLPESIFVQPEICAHFPDAKREPQVKVTKFNNIKSKYINESNKDIMDVSPQSNKKRQIHNNCFPTNSYYDTWRNNRNLRGGKTVQFGLKTAKKIENT